MQMAIRWGIRYVCRRVACRGRACLAYRKAQDQHHVRICKQAVRKNERNWKFANTVFALTMRFVGALIAVETAVINLLKAD